MILSYTYSFGFLTEDIDWLIVKSNGMNVLAHQITEEMNSRLSSVGFLRNTRMTSNIFFRILESENLYLELYNEYWRGPSMDDALPHG